MKIDFTFAVLFLLLVFLAYSALFLPPKRYGDASTYYMITQSIIHDFDIRYEERDLARVLQNPFEDVPAGMYLIKNYAERSYYFAKEYMYSLLSAPFVALGGPNGFIFFNALMLWLMIYLAYKFLSERTDKNIALLVSLLFFIFSLPFVYVYWIHPDLYCMFLVFLSYYFWFGRKEEKKRIRFLGIHINTREFYEVVACIFIGLAAYEKLPCVFLSAGFFIDKILNHDLRGFVRSAFFVALPPLILFGAYYLMTGEFHSHSGDRYYYAPSTGYPFANYCNFDNECGNKAFSLEKNSISYDGGVFSLLGSIKTFPQSLFNYFFGRYAGIMLYNFPLILCLISMEGIKRKNLLILVSVIIFISYYALVQQTNYAGLGHAVGNRYFYAYPIFIFLIDRVRTDKKFLVVSAVILILGFPLASSPMTVSSDPASNTRNFPYKFFPLELPMMPFNMGTVNHNSTLYYFDGDFYPQQKEGSWLRGKSSGTIFVVLEGRNEVNFSVHLNAYLCAVNAEVSTNRDEKKVNLGPLDGGEVVVKSYPVSYMYSIDSSVHAIRISADNGCQPSEYAELFQNPDEHIRIQQNLSSYGADADVIARYLGVFVRYPVVTK